MIYYNDPSEEVDQCNIFQGIKFSCEGGTQKTAILLTPRCDLVTEGGKNPKAKYLKFAALENVEPVIRNILSQLRLTKDQISGKEYVDKETFEKVDVALRNFVNGTIYPRYFFLPALDPSFGYSVIDFQMLEVVKYSKELLSSLKASRVAQISSSWREAIPVRYANYSSRIGLKEYPDTVYEDMLKKMAISLVRSS